MSLSSQLASYIKGHGEWISGKTLEDHGWKNKKGNTYKASNVSRRLRELENDGILESRGNPVEYRYKTHTKKVIEYVLKFEDGMPIRRPVVKEILA